MSLKKIILVTSKTIDTITDIYEKLAHILVLVMIILGVWNVLGRWFGKLLGYPLTSNLLLEAQWYLFSIILLLGSAIALKNHSHVGIDVFQVKMSARSKKHIYILGCALFLMPFCLMIVYTSWKPALISWQLNETSPDPNGLLRYPLKLFLVYSFFHLLLQGLSESLKRLYLQPLSQKDSTHE